MPETLLNDQVWRSDALAGERNFSCADGLIWVCIHARWRKEFSVRDDLEKEGIEVFLPLEKKWIAKARKKTEREDPLFVGYLFAHIDPESRAMYEINGLDGVIGVLSNNGMPMRVSPEFISELKSAQEIGLFDRTTEILRIPPGSDVRVTRGPFAGFIGKLQSARGKKRAEILIELFGRMTTHNIPLSWVRLA